MATDKDYLGTGWQFPPGFSKSNVSAKAIMTSGGDDILQSLQILLTTNLGERLMQPNYGAGLDHLLFENIGQTTIGKIENAVSDAILLFEPRVRVTNIDITEDDSEPGLLQIDIDYTIPINNSRFNLVFPFYINEASVAV